MDYMIHMEKEFHLPRYVEIPNVGLYLKQVVKFSNDAVEPILHTTVTETMLSNYVKLHLVSNPVKKQYSRDQIADMIFIILAKNALSLENVTVLLSMLGEHYTKQEAYDYFCERMETALRCVYANRDSAVSGDVDSGQEKALLNNMIATIANRCFLEDCFAVLKQRSADADMN